jgi:hypothetical protein
MGLQSPGPGPTAPSGSRLLPYVVVGLLVASTVSWRRGVYFSGSFDPVVVLKGLLSLAALGLALAASRRSRHRTPLGARTVVFLAAFLLVTCLGALAAGSAFASIVVAARVAILGASVALLLQAFDPSTVIRAMVRVMAATAALAAASGVGSVASGRLAGGIPPMPPNQLAFLCGVVMLSLVRRVAENRETRQDWLGIVVLLGVVWLTGSRTGLAALLVAVVVMLTQTRVLSLPLFLGLVALLPVTGYLFLATDAVSGLFTRGGEQNVTTLSSRTIAWDAVLQFSGGWWQTWFGGGLAMKEVPVAGQYWNAQVLDSSWMSALVQGGLVGFAIAATWVLAVVIASVRTGSAWRPMWLGMLVFLVIRSVLESGLFDAAPAFLVFMVVSLMSEPPSRGSLVTEIRSRAPDVAQPAAATSPSHAPRW